jgi:ribosomal protein L27
MIIVRQRGTRFRRPWCHLGRDDMIFALRESSRAPL